MSINILMVIVVAFILSGAITGFKRGLVESVMRLVTTVLGIIVLAVLIDGVENFLEKSYVKVAIALVLLLLLNIFHKIGKLILDSCKLVSKLPVVNSVDKIAGIVFGAVEVICVIWIIFLLINAMDPFGMREWMMNQITENTFLTMLYRKNGLLILLQYVVSQVSVFEQWEML